MLNDEEEKLGKLESDAKTSGCFITALAVALIFVTLTLALWVIFSLNKFQTFEKHEDDLVNGQRMLQEKIDFQEKRIKRLEALRKVWNVDEK